MNYRSITSTPGGILSQETRFFVLLLLNLPKFERIFA
jgi:hypothetical protein